MSAGINKRRKQWQAQEARDKIRRDKWTTLFVRARLCGMKYHPIVRMGSMLKFRTQLEQYEERVAKEWVQP